MVRREVAAALPGAGQRAAGKQREQREVPVRQQAWVSGWVAVAARRRRRPRQTSWPWRVWHARPPRARRAFSLRPRPHLLQTGLLDCRRRRRQTALRLRIWASSSWQHLTQQPRLRCPSRRSHQTAHHHPRHRPRTATLRARRRQTAEALPGCPWVARPRQPRAAWARVVVLEFWLGRL